MINPRFPLISVIMAVYNGEKYLAEAIDSVLSQSYSNFEFIIINDGSTDSTIDIISKYANKDNRIVVIDRENKGLPYSLNEGIAKAKGEYIARMDADDICLPNRFEKQLKYINENNLDLCGTFAVTFGKNITKSILKYPENHNDIKFNLLFSSAFAHPTVMLRRAVFNKVKYESKYLVAQDYQLWIDIINSGFKGGNIPEVLMKYRVHEEQASSNRIKLQQDTAREIRKNFYKNINNIDVSMISRYLKLFEGKQEELSLQELNSLLLDIQNLAKEFKVTDDLIAEYLRSVYNLTVPKSPLRYLIYRRRTEKYKKNRSDELKLLVKSLILNEKNSKTLKVLKIISNKFNL